MSVSKFYSTQINQFKKKIRKVTSKGKHKKEQKKKDIVNLYIFIGGDYMPLT